MDVITQRRCLAGLAGGLMLGAIGASAWSLSSLPQRQANLQNGPASVVSPTQEESDDIESAFDSSNLALTLRQDLEDAPPPRPKPTPPPRKVNPPPRPAPTPPLKLTLLATIIDSERSLAVITDDSGSLDSKGVGESLSLSTKGVSIVSIESDQVTLAHNGRESTLTVNKKRKGGGPVRQRNNNNRRNNR